MGHAQGDTDPQLINPSENATNVIVDMNVTVSNVKKSKALQRSRGILLFLAAILLAIVLSHLFNEVRALQVQIQSVNVNLLLLMSKYDRLSRNLNRAWIQRSNKFSGNDNMQEVKRLLVEASSMLRMIEILEDTRNETNKSTYDYNSLVPYLNSIRRVNDSYSRNDIRRANEGNRETNTGRPVMKVERGYLDNDGDGNSLRIERAILTIEKQNMTGKSDAELNRGTVARYNHTADDYADNDDNDSNDSNVWREPRSGRSRRDEGRGKKRGKNKRRPKRSRRRLGPLVATFVGAIPEQHVTDTVYIGPWVKSAKNNTQYSLNKFHLVEDKKSIEVTATGLYMISAQIFYFGEPTNYSYWILLSSEGKSTTQKLVKCSTASSTSATEVSCYTSIITPLQRGDRVHIQQQERDRLINMREGHSYIQLVLLSNNIRKRHLK